MGAVVNPGQEMALRVLRELRKKLPTVFPVRVKFDTTMKNYGDCDLKKLRHKQDKPFFLVRLNEAACEEPMVAWDLAVHEYAHALAWTRAHKPGRSKTLTDHGPMWGVAYAACYTVAEKFL